MRIILIVSDLSVGGAEQNLVNYALALQSRGHWVAVVAGDGPLAVRLESAGIPRLARRSTLRRPWSILRAAVALAAEARRARVEIVHCFMSSSSVVAAVARWLLHLAGAETYAIVAAVPGLAQHAGEPPWIAKARLWLLARPAEIVLVPSPAFGQALERLGASRLRVRAFEYNALPVATFRRTLSAGEAKANLNVPAIDKVVVIVGRLHPIKRVHLAIRAFSRVLSSVPEARLLVVGGGPCENELRVLCGLLHIEGRVSFVGEQADVRPYLHAATVALQTMAGFGGAGLATMEALAAGLPVVCFDVADRRQALAGCPAAIFVHDGDVDAFAREVAELLSDPRRAVDLGELGRSWVTARCDWASLGDRLEPLYAAAIEMRHAAPASADRLEGSR